MSIALDNSPAITPEVIEEHSITPEEYRTILKALGRTPSLTELGHLQRDVERALLLQIVAACI